MRQGQEGSRTGAMCDRGLAMVVGSMVLKR